MDSFLYILCTQLFSSLVIIPDDYEDQPDDESNSYVDIPVESFYEHQSDDHLIDLTVDSPLFVDHIHHEENVFHESLVPDASAQSCTVSQNQKTPRSKFTIFRSN